MRDPVRPHADSRSRGQALAEFALVAPMLFVLLVGIFEAGRFVLNNESLHNATREGARYAIVHGAKSTCPTGPMPPLQTNRCVDGPDPTGTRIRAVVQDTAAGIADLGKLTVPTPIWTAKLSTSLPTGPGDTSIVAGDNGRGNFVTVWADYSYDPIFKTIFRTDLIPSITISAESTLVINN